MQETLTDFLEECEFGDTSLAGDDLFAILECLDGAGDFPPATASTPLNGTTSKESSGDILDVNSPPKRKRQRLEGDGGGEDEQEKEEEEGEDKKQYGQTKMSHITVERNRRKQMNEHLSVLRSLMPCFYVKRGDQASIIGGVVEYINELQQVLQSLEAKKQRKAYAEVLSPRPSPPVHSPRKPPLPHHHHHIIPPISPRTPQPPSSPYRAVRQPYSPSPSSSPSRSVNELVANSKSAVAEIEVKSSGANVVLKTVSHRIPGQAVKIIAALQDLALDILQVDINTVDETMLNSFTIKIGIECQLSAEELAQQIQQTFCYKSTN